MKLIPPWAQALIVLALLAFVFGAGWKVSSWRAGSQQAAAADARVAALSKSIEDATADLKDRVAALDQFNADTNASQQAALDEIRKAQRALQGVRDEISTVDVGGASVTADGDRLRIAAYRAATATSGK